MFNRLFYLLSAVILVCAITFTTQVFADDFSEFKIAQGKGSFTQAKHFTFLKRAINSNGEFVINDSQVYWRTTAPVSSEMLLLPSGIYQRQNAKSEYKLVTKDEEINQLLAKLLSGYIEDADWNITSEQSNCYLLTPKLESVAILFSSVQLCTDKAEQRSIVITDQQNNETHINMQVISKELDQSDMEAVKLSN